MSASAASSATAAKIELILWKGSQFSHKAIAALKLKGLLPVVHYTMVGGPDVRKPAEMKRLLPPPYTIPCMKWDDEVIAGSDHICAFLDEKIPLPPLYPQLDGIHDLEQRCSKLYWPNGFLSMYDSAGFDRFAGTTVRQYTKSNYKIAAPILRLAPKTAWNIIHSVVKKDFVATMKRRNASIQDERSVDVVYKMAREELASLDKLLASSPTDFFAGATSPSAADLTLYAMLERWVGDSMQPGVHGPAQPKILEGLAATERLFAQVKAAGGVDLTQVKDYPTLTTPLGNATYPKKAELDVTIKGGQ